MVILSGIFYKYLANDFLCSCVIVGQVTGVYKKQEFGRSGGEINSYFDFFGED